MCIGDRNSPRIRSLDTLEEAASSWESAVDMVAARIPAKITPASNAGSTCLLYTSRARKRSPESPALSAPQTLEAQLRRTATVFRDLYDSLSRSSTPPNDENIATVFDRAADQICRALSLIHI